MPEVHIIWRMSRADRELLDDLLHEAEMGRLEPAEGSGWLGWPIAEHLMQLMRRVCSLTVRRRRGQWMLLWETSERQGYMSLGHTMDALGVLS